MSVRRFLGVVIALVLFTSAAAAQTGVRLQVQYLLSDSIVAGEPGADISVDLYAVDNGGWGLNSYTLKIPFDATRLEIVAATTLCPDSAPINLTPGSGFALISAPSCGAYPYGQSFARLTMRLLPGVTDGTIVGLQALALTDNAAQNRLNDFSADWLQVCHADGQWGDIDHDAAINSRDALIALSNAVGIPTGGFNVSRGDVDADGQVTSRDALAMLSASIGLSTDGFRVGLGIADACARQPVFARPVYFLRDGPVPGVPGVSGLAIRTANDSSVTIPGDSSDIGQYQWRPRVSPDGSVLIVCFNEFGWANICKTNADGSGVVNLTNTTQTELSPDWSPAGDSVVFVAQAQIWIMDANGSGVRLVGGQNLVSSVAWKPGSRILAYTNNGGALGQIHTLDLDTGGDATILDAGSHTYTQNPRFVDWNAAGDSVLFDVELYFLTSVVSVPATGGPLATRISLVNGGAYHPVWTDAGVLFVSYYAGHYRILLAKGDGTYAIVGHDTEQNFAPGMKRVP